MIYFSVGASFLSDAGVITNITNSLNSELLLNHSNSNVLVCKREII